MSKRKQDRGAPSLKLVYVNNALPSRAEQKRREEIMDYAEKYGCGPDCDFSVGPLEPDPPLLPALK